jgi:hypothetical protein
MSPIATMAVITDFLRNLGKKTPILSFASIVFGMRIAVLGVGTKFLIFIPSEYKKIGLTPAVPNRWDGVVSVLRTYSLK